MSEEIYQKHKLDLLSRFVDSSGLVLNRLANAATELPDTEWGKDHGDAAWRTGLATICTAIEQDHATTHRFLLALRDQCWKEGRPVRHPRPWQEISSTPFSRDQFIPQMAACFYAWKFGNAENQNIAKELLARFIDLLLANNFRFNDGEAAFLTTPGQIALREVARSMGLRSDWQPSIDASLTDVEKMIREKADKAIQEELGEVPPFLRSVVKELVLSLFGNLRSLLDGLEQVADLPKPIQEALKLPFSDRDSFFATLFSYYTLAQGEIVASQGDDVEAFYGIHNYFWEVLLMYECRPDAPDLKDNTKRLYHACRKHRMMLYYWIRGEGAREEASQFLNDWQAWYNHVDYFWSKDKHSQERDQAEIERGEIPDKEFPRIDYMVLHRLFDLELR